MEIVKVNEYEDLAMEFQYKIIEILNKTLKEKGIPEDKRKEVCGDFSFDMAMFIDQDYIQLNGKSFQSSISFESEKNLYINSGVLFHEYAFGVVSDFFEK